METHETVFCLVTLFVILSKISKIRAKRPVHRIRDYIPLNIIQNHKINEKCFVHNLQYNLRLFFSPAHDFLHNN